MVNYKRVVCELALLAAAVAIAASAPVPECAQNHYDQRQNGSENYRLNIDGVVIAVAPADSLLAAASEIDISDLLGDLEDFNDIQKPTKPSINTNSPVKPEDPKPEEKPQDLKPEEAKPSFDQPAAAPLADVSLDSENKPLKKDASTRKHEKAQKLKNRLAHLLMPLLRRNRHH
ncbi:uncharacterized protein LOC106141905 [Amyelois transitella]|uniref:uncharacterized protein LOC106141905 n=1 Tax=Amyelois transitella TaxID=680683 RepID=UPI00298FA551|nr:uncharacterized protein LOC106141905 [Amyelois transitella]